ncbi:hypothetical protein F4604DRAFT_1193439 [Suillus subluteus]|nr:hypothetical protein F4604DRAFT_1193439 [Suillus subluteus]
MRENDMLLTDHRTADLGIGLENFRSVDRVSPFKPGTRNRRIPKLNTSLNRKSEPIRLRQRRRCYTLCNADTLSHSIQVSDYRWQSPGYQLLSSESMPGLTDVAVRIFLISDTIIWLSATHWVPCSRFWVMSMGIGSGAGCETPYFYSTFWFPTSRHVEMSILNTDEFTKWLKRGERTEKRPCVCNFVFAQTKDSLVTTEFRT